MTKNRLAIRQQYGPLAKLTSVIALLTIPILAFHNIPAAGDSTAHHLDGGATAPWNQTSGPPGTTINVIFKTNNIVYAGTEAQGVYKSTDNGLNWKAANIGIERASISDITFSGANLLAAGKSTCPTYNNVFKSTDNGATWTGTTGLQGKIANAFVIKGAVVWATFNALPGESGIARSTDNGNTWQSVEAPITDAGKAIVSNDAIIVAEDNFIWRSTDDGASWDPVEQFNLTGISSFARIGTKIFGASGSGIESSTNNGASWTFQPFSGGAQSFSANGNTVYLGSSSKVFRSTDLGATWNDMSTGLGNGSIQALLYDGSTVFAATPDDAAGIYRTTNGGGLWSAAATGLPIASNLRSLIAFGGQVFAGMQGNGIYRSSDHGNTWQKTDVNNALLTHQLVLAFCAKGNALYAGAANGIYKSVDGGATFQRTLNGFPANQKVTAYALTVSGGNIVAAVSVQFSPSSVLQGIFYSPDDGSTWHQASLPITPTAVTAVASDGSSLAYAGVFGQSFSVKGLYKSTDGGVTWTQRQALNVDIERLAAKGSNVLAGDLFGAYYSTDFGESWAFSDPGNCPQGCGIFTYTIKGNSIFAGNTEGMFESTNGGATWTQIIQNFPTCPLPVVEASCADDSFLFAGTTGEAVWRKLLGTQALQLTSAVSRKSHGSAGTFDIDLPQSGTPGIECRSGGATNDYQLVLTFADAVSVNGNPQASVTSGIGTIGSGGSSNGGMVTVAGNVVTIPLTNVANVQTINVTVNNVNSSTNFTIPMSILIGDTNNTGTVNASDIGSTKVQVGMPVTNGNFRSDANATSAINASDVSLVKSHSGQGLP
jgi:photosystem II stability/assembly factor-like uncharacterized protein